MKAWVIDAGAGSAPGQAALRLADVDEPCAGAGELLVEVRAVGLNRADLSRRAGHYERIATRPQQPIAGLEAAGTVIAVGPDVEGFALGDPVMGMPSGAYAERALLDARLAMRVPAGLAWTEAASARRGFVFLFTDSAPGEQLRGLRVRLSLER
jgi:NADPH:quinone reductase-like Zn-dependent oxidoreductase